MIVTKATHEAMLKEKDKHIAALKDEIQWLRNFVQPAHSRPLLINYEADSVLNGGSDEVPAPALSPEIALERDRILAGTY